MGTTSTTTITTSPGAGRSARRASRPGRTRRIVAATVAAVVAGVGLFAVQQAAPVAATGAEHPTLVSPVPTSRTPHVTNGNVHSVAEVGSTVVLGGDFTTSTDPDGTVVNRSYLLAFDKATGLIRRDFAPQLDNEVYSVVAAEDGQSVYVGGRFNTVDGVRQQKVARISIADGRPLPFASGVDAVVTTMALHGDRLYIGGVFTKVQNRTRRVAALNARTGVIDDNVDVPFVGTHRGSGDGKIWRIEPSPDGQQVVVVGSFATVGGQPRNQIAKLSTPDGQPASLSPWSTTAFAGTCSSFADYVRDVSYSPDGSYFVVVTTGSKGTGINGQCDATSRWADSLTAGATPQWTMYSGGDSVYSVEVTGAVVYIGGHFRWTNNPFGTDTLGAGGIARTGIAALDPDNGLPLSWNPGRTRGRAVWQMVATSDGLWVVSDTDRIAEGRYRGRNAFFPLTGGLPVPQPERLVLPVQLDQYVPASGGTPARVTSRSYDGSTVGSPTTIVSSASALSGVRAAFQAGNVLYTAHTNGTLQARSFDGTTLGAPVAVDLLGLSSFASDLADMNGAVFDDGRLYYTVSGSNTLHMRYFSPESRVIGALRFDVASSSGGLSYRDVGGMVLAGSHVYYVDRSNGTLARATWRDAGGIDPATRTTISPSNANGLSWTNTVLWARQGEIPNQPPTAALGVDCTGLRCELDSAGSADADGTVVGTAWSFGDGATASGPTASHTFATPGTYTVTVTVTDDDGATGLASQQVIVEDSAPSASFEVACVDGTCSVDASASADLDGSVTGYAWDFGDGTSGTGVTATHSYAASGSYSIGLTVTDDRGLTATATRQVDVVVPVGRGFVAVNGSTGQASLTSHQVTIPADVRAGDQLVLHAASNAPGTATLSAPAGWTVAAQGGTSGSRASVWVRTATASDAGSTVAVGVSTAARVDLTVSAYRGLTRVTPSPALVTGYTTPATTAPQGAWVLSFWADKSATTTGWTAPTGVTVRRSFAGTGAGHVATLVADSGGAVPAGPVGGLTATVATPVTNSVALTLVLAPAT